METMWPQLATITFNDLNKLDIPVILFLGPAPIYATPAAVAAASMEQLKHPKKVTVWFEKLGGAASS